MMFSSYWVEPVSDDDVVHYGVKGMKWGVRKAEYRSMSRQERKQQRKNYKKKINRPNKSYTIKQRMKDELRYFTGASTRINKGLNQGLSRKEIDKRERRRRATLIGAAALSASVTSLIYNNRESVKKGIAMLQLSPLLMKQAAHARKVQAAQGAMNSAKRLYTANVVNVAANYVRDRKR